MKAAIGVYVSFQRTHSVMLLEIRGTKGLELHEYHVEAVLGALLQLILLRLVAKPDLLKQVIHKVLAVFRNLQDQLRKV